MRRNMVPYPPDDNLPRTLIHFYRPRISIFNEFGFVMVTEFRVYKYIRFYVYRMAVPRNEMPVYVGSRRRSEVGMIHETRPVGHG